LKNPEEMMERVQGFKGSRVQGFKGSRVQGFKGSRVQGFKGLFSKDLISPLSILSIPPALCCGDVPHNSFRIC